MFGFGHDGQTVNPLSPQAYAAGSCAWEPWFEWCNSFCQTNPSAPNCIAYKQSQQSKLSKLAGTMDQILSFLYLIMWPLLYVAWLAMDNTLIYGEWLGLTGLLFQFWTIMRTFANYVIVFLLVRTIGKEMLNGTKWAKALGKAVLWILVSWVLINMSWFLIGAMVDVSTIATYGVWAIPLKLQTPGDDYCDENGLHSTKEEFKIKNNKDIAKLWTCRPILATHGTMNLSDTFSADQAKWKVYYSYTPKTAPKQYFLSCPFKNSVLAKEEWDTLYNGFKNEKTYNEWWNTGNIAQMDADAKNALSNEYCVVWTNQLLDITSVSKEWWGTIELYSTWYESAIVWWVTQLHTRDGMRVKNLVESNKGMIGVMYTMYGNMLWFANIKTDIQTNAPESQIIQFLVKIFFGFAIMFPLIALCVVLVMRVAVLWMVVWFSPLLVLWWTLKLMKVENSTLDSMMKWIWEKLTLANVVNLLFQPVMIVFTISMGMMFLDTLSTTIVADNGFGEALQCEMRSWEQCCSIVSVMNICFEKVNAQVGTDAFFNYFTFTIINIIGVMILWFMVFAVMKSSKITESAVSKIQWLGRNILWSMPVVPWFDGGFVWFDGAKDGLGKAFDKVTEEYKDTSGETITKPWVDKQYETITWAAGTAQKKIMDEIPESMTEATIATDQWAKDFGQHLLTEIGKAKKDVNYATANKLVDESDPRIKKLFEQYWDVDNFTQLLANPAFMADNNLDTKSAWWTYKVGKDKTKYDNLWREDYLSSLKTQSDNMTQIGSWNKYYYKNNNKKILFEKTVNKDEEVELTPLKMSIPDRIVSSNYTYEEIQWINNQLTKEEFTKLVGTDKVAAWSKEKPWREAKPAADTKLMNINKIDYEDSTPPGNASSSDSGTWN